MCLGLCCINLRDHFIVGVDRVPLRHSSLLTFNYFVVL